MIVIKGKNNGFCFGVKRATKSAFSLTGERRFVLGEIIHNEDVNAKLKSCGVVQIDDVNDQRLFGGDTVLIRTHGEPKKTFEILEKKGVNIVDCTCPFVKEIHSIVRNWQSVNLTKIVVLMLSGALCLDDNR